MSEQEFATPTAPAETVESAPTPVEVVEEQPAASEESAPVEIAQITEEEGSEPKAVRELKEQRKKRQQAQQEAAYWKGVAEGRIQPQSNTPAPQTQAPVSTQLVAPKLDDFETYEEFESAKETYLVEKAKRAFTQEIQQRMQQTESQKIEMAFQERLAQEAENDPSISEIALDPTLPVSDAMASILKRSQLAPQILKYLHNNRTEAASIARMPPMEAAYKLGIVEAGLKAAPKTPPPKKVSMAPEPIKTVQTSGSQTIDEDKLPVDEWIARRNATAGRR